ncbi:hypothetical protein [Enterococcus pallens]|uniref:Uncharacterized protein n=1 Tax=Enterococcus pallens ATCC BAA-351 TaxID=1158607 RepID=R2SES7_9ENTE|nr:hypothetical protein [Enterococcus pallens]EOH86689.1 hypothetical protein UAU_05134 [Enterococcus pallens ATCC BAA-351]EOU18485.1 hypothetical protein I588_03479 [Enterococcus pallens ATCC BAA-351]OJG76505.1 hypothetical protein RV10_GL003642 [Enterococcus pallens]
MPINYLAQTGALEDLVWSIMNDAETEAHADRLKSAFNRDLENEPDDQARDIILDEIRDVELLKEKVRDARYSKTNLSLALAAKVAENDQQDKYSCMFKHQLMSMAEMRDAAAAIQDTELREYADKTYEKTAVNASVTIAKFLGLPVENCMACLFEKNKIENSGE